MPSFKNANPPMDRATFRANLAAIPRAKIAHLPTPLEELHRLSAELGGPRILIKRDDATGLAMGGNKARHYEYELAHLIEQGYDAYVNMMDYHSNNARMTAAASNKFGIKYSCVLRYAAGREIQGNLLIDKILGADLHLLNEEQSELSKAEEYARELGRKLEAEGYKYTIRLKANTILQQSIAYMLTRPVGRPPNHVQRFHASFSYQAGSWDKKRRVVAKVEWHPGELYPRVGFIVTNLARPANRVVAFYNQRGTAEQHIKEGKNAIVWTRLSCMRFRNNEVRLQLHALAYNLANFMRTLALPEAVKHWSLTSLRQKLVKIGARIVGHGRYVTFQMAEVAVPRGLFDEILRLIAQLRAPPAPA